MCEETMSSIASWFKSAAPAITAGATVATTAASLMQGQAKQTDVQDASTASLSDEDVQAEANETRRRLLMRKGGKSTVMTDDSIGPANIFKSVLGGK